MPLLELVNILCCLCVCEFAATQFYANLLFKYKI